MPVGTMLGDNGKGTEELNLIWFKRCLRELKDAVHPDGSQM